VKQGDWIASWTPPRHQHPQDREILHVLRRVHHRRAGRHPGAAGHERRAPGAKVHIVTAAVSSAQNIVKCCGRTGLQVADIVLEPLASAEAVLAEEEKELGVALVTSGRHTDLAIFSGADPAHQRHPAGRQSPDQRHRVGLRTPMQEAEKIKVKFGSGRARAWTRTTPSRCERGGRAPRVLNRRILCEIIERGWRSCSSWCSARSRRRPGRSAGHGLS